MFSCVTVSGGRPGRGSSSRVKIPLWKCLYHLYILALDGKLSPITWDISSKRWSSVKAHKKFYSKITRILVIVQLDISLRICLSRQNNYESRLSSFCARYSFPMLYPSIPPPPFSLLSLFGVRRLIEWPTYLKQCTIPRINQILARDSKYLILCNFWCNSLTWDYLQK